MSNIDQFVKVRLFGKPLDVKYVPLLWKFMRTLPIEDNPVSDPHLLRHPKFYMYGKERHQRRDVGFFVSDPKIKGYKYSNQSIPSQPLPGILKDFLKHFNEKCKTNHNSILVNRYENGQDYISAHSDDERELVPSANVSSLSLGGKDSTRTFIFKDKKTKKIVKKLELCPGTLVDMLPGCQKRFTHQINKTQKHRGIRISLTLRTFKTPP